MNRVGLITAAFATLVSTGASAETFASFDGVGSAVNMKFDAAPGAPNGGTLSGISGKQVLFDFKNDALPPLLAGFSFSATTSDNAVKIGNLVVQGGFAGSFDFFYEGPAGLTINGIPLNPHALLLHGSFLDATLSGTGAAGSINGSEDGLMTLSSEIQYSSPFESFALSGHRDWSLSLANITKPTGTTGAGLSVTGGQLRSFTAFATGSFSSNPMPILNGVPEASTWGMMIVGLGFAGGALRRSRPSRMRQTVAA